MNALTNPSLPLQWHPITESLPPDPDGPGWWSPDVWLALSDGTVESGKCLHKSPQATYKAPVHDWFIGDTQLCAARPRGVKVVAWMPFAVPDFPSVLLTQPEQEAMRRALRRSMRILA
jgi:hypothetical protein